MRTFIYDVGAEDDGRILWRVVRSRLHVSAHQFSSLKMSGGLLLNQENVHANIIVHTGDQISLTLTADTPTPATPEDLPVNVVYEDTDLLVIDKPAPLPCQSSPRQPGGTLENRLAFRYRDLPAYTFRPVNRLDKGTSGLMVVARNAHAQMLLQNTLHTPSFIRCYQAIVIGAPVPACGIINQPIAKAPGATIRRTVDNLHGKPSVTHYETLGVFGDYALIRLLLETGRTHQIRVHMQSIGHPILGDFLYGTEDPRFPGRFALHSCETQFIHPITGQSMHFTSPLPPAFLSLLQPQQGRG